MAIHIEFDTDDLRPEEAAGLARLLQSLHPDCCATSVDDVFLQMSGRAERPTQDGEFSNSIPTVAQLIESGHLPPAEGIEPALQTRDPAAVFGEPHPFTVQHTDGVAPIEEVAAPQRTAAEVFGDGPQSTGATPAAPPAPAASSAVELDRNGLPWDGRIHSTPAKKKGDQTWRAKRGVSPLLVTEVEAELRQVMAATPGQAQASPPAPPPSVPSPPPASPDTAPSGTPSVTPAIVPPPPAAPAGPGPNVVPPTPTASPSETVLNPAQQFAAFMKRVGAAQNRDVDPLTTDEVKDAVEACGLTKVGDLLKRPDLIADVEAVLACRSGM